MKKLILTLAFFASTSIIQISARVPACYIQGELPAAALKFISPVFLTFIHASGKPVPVTYKLVSDIGIAERLVRRQWEEELYDLHWQAWAEKNDSKRAFSGFIAHDAQAHFDKWFNSHKQ